MQLPVAQFLQIKSIIIRGENAPSFDSFTVFNRGKTVASKDVRPKISHEKGLPIDKTKDKNVKPEPVQTIQTNGENGNNDDGDDDDDEPFTKSKSLLESVTGLEDQISVLKNSGITKLTTVEPYSISFVKF